MTVSRVLLGLSLALALSGKPVSAEVVRTGAEDFQRSQLFADCWWDPSLYSRAVLRRTPYPWQSEADAAITQNLRDGIAHSQLVYKKNRGSGGTDDAAAKVHWFMGTRHGAQGVDTAPTFRQVQSIFWPRFRKQFQGSILPSLGFGSIFETKISYGEDYFFEGLSTDDDFKAEGYHSTSGMVLVFDEAKGIRDSVYSSFIGTLTTEQSLRIYVSTPGFEFGHFYDLFTGPEREGLIRLDISGARCQAEGIVGMEKLEQELRDGPGVDSDEYQSQWLARFIKAVRGGLIPSADIERAIQRHDAIREGLVEPIGIRHSSLDVAASEVGKGDKSVLGNWIGNDLLEVHVWQIRDTTEMHRDAFMRAKAWGSVRLRPDTPGLGIGIMNELRHAAKKDGGRMVIEEYWEGGPPADPESMYSNRHSEAVNVAALKLRAGVSAIPRRDSDGNEIPWRELSQYRKHPTDEHRYRVEKKGRDSKGRPEKSPDFADMFVIGLAPDAPDKMQSALAAYAKMNDRLRKEGRL